MLLVMVLVALSLSAHAAPTKPKASEVKMWNGRPTIFINGEAHMPQIYALTDFRGGRFSYDEIPKRNIDLFTQLGFKLFQVDVWLQEIWAQNGKLDIDLVARQVGGVLAVNPEAAVFIRFHVNAPRWWNLLHPEETVIYATGPVDTKEYGPPLQVHYGDTERHLRHSLASQAWRDSVTPKLKEMLRALAKRPEGRSVVGIHVAGGVYGEWHPWGFPSEEPDLSAPMQNFFRGWLRAKYRTDAELQKAWDSPSVTLAHAQVPELAARDRTLNGMFRDVAKERPVMDYYEAQQDNIVENILHFTEVVKTTWPRPIIAGTFYGYFFSTFGRQAVGAHLRFNRVLASKWVDYVSAPQSYFGYASEIGGTGQSRGLVESARLAGKLFLDEMDTRTHLQRPTDDAIADDPKSAALFTRDIALLRRNVLHPLLRGHGLWYYDFGAVYNSGSWDHPKFHAELKALREVTKKAWATPHNPTADVLVVYEPASVFAMHSKWNTVNESLIDRLSAAVYRAGAMADFVCLDDLPRVKLSQYKAVLFAHATRVLPEERAFIRNVVAKEGRHLLWTYMAGYFDGANTNDTFPSVLTGITMKRLSGADWPKGNLTVVVEAKGAAPTRFKLSAPIEPMMAVADNKAEPIAHLADTPHVMVAKKTLPDSTAWVGTLSLHDPDLLRFIFRQAGAHIYNEANDSIVASMNLLMVHTRDGGKRTLTLRNGVRINTTLPAQSTSLFDAETGASLLPSPQPSSGL